MSNPWVVVPICLQVSNILISLTGLLVFGSVLTGFMKYMENIDAGEQDELFIGKACLAKFRQLKKGFAPYLLAMFTINTLNLMIQVFLDVEILKNIGNIAQACLLMNVTGFTLSSAVPLMYIVLMAEDAKSKFQNILPLLR